MENRSSQFTIIYWLVNEIQMNQSRNMLSYLKFWDLNARRPKLSVEAIVIKFKIN